MTNLQNMIREILNREDIEGLLALGAPGDEYSSEAELISQAIESRRVEPREEELTKLLRGIWQRMFGPFSEEEMKEREPALERVAVEVALMCLNRSTE